MNPFIEITPEQYYDWSHQQKKTYSGWDGFIFSECWVTTDDHKSAHIRIHICNDRIGNRFFALPDGPYRYDLGKIVAAILKRL
jgi:hypothetical protein